MKKLSIFAAVISVASPALAGPFSQDTVFGNVSPVSEFALSEVRGTAAPVERLTRTTLRTAADRLSRDDSLFTGAIARIQMDVWWGSVGSEMIANAVRADR